MKKIAFIPLDNRPVCYDLAIDICNCSNDFEIFLPPIENIGGLFDVADFEAILKWFENLKDLDYIIVALDTIAYGALVASRRTTMNYDEIKERLEKFKQILIQKKAKILAFSSIMRISNNNVNEEEKEYWNRYGKKIFDYSFNLHKSEVIKDNDSNAKFSCISNVIPKEILDDYLSTRERNFNINKLYIEWLNEGVLDTLVFSKDDCAQFGLNVKEAQELEKLLTRLNGIVKTGADEIPLSLLSRVITENKKIKIYPYFVNEKSKDLISKYEDVSVEKSALGQIKLANCKVVNNKGNADIVMVINNFDNEQGELVMNVDAKLFEGEIPEFDKPTLYVDINFANGADNNFAKKLLEKDLKNKNYLGYTAWNTTANTIGSGLCIALSKYCSDKFNQNNFEKLQLIRFLDDWAYQANVRKQIRDNVQNLENNIIYEKMSSFENILKAKFSYNNINYSYPWNRFFEIRVKIS